MFEFTVKEGDAVLFPPGWMHETYNVAEGCTAALTTQFTLPAPARYFHHYYTRLRRTGDLSPCWEQMQGWAMLDDPEARHAQVSANTTAAKAFGDALWARRAGGAAVLSAAGGSGGVSKEAVAFYDADGDGTLTREEFMEAFVAWWLTEHMVRRERVVKMPKMDMSFEPEAPAGQGARASGEL
eukprot:NODE_14184_length_1123_cov_6.334337.p2 GENE.NODE_14184_length_1123_cov_6.334337~~NODE_14184_length_1123_cov_6.334337.p2  ORF type:complete len:183 (+),score=58.21 NODE_14184_length_1123_cov_6.334337:423-971(+)